MLGNDDGLKRFTTPPEQRVDSTPNSVEPAPEPSAQAPVTEPTVVTPPAEPAQPAKVSEPQPDKFFEDFNKRFNTSFKGDDDVKNVLGLQQKIAEYEPKVKQAESYAKEIEAYKQQIEEIKNAGNSEFLSKPLVRSAYVAQQLLDKYPDKDPFVLQEIAMSDLSKMGDLDVLIKEQKMDLPTLAESDIRVALLDKYGIDPETKPVEWSSIAKTKIAIDAKGARANIKSLTSGIELPKTVTAEERQAKEAEDLQKRIQATEPLKAKFSQFDKFKDERIPELGDYDVPSDYKSKLGDMFQATFIDAGMEPTEENLQSAIDLRNAFMVYENLPKIWEIAVKHGQTSVQKKVDAELHNDVQPNTTTATDDNDLEPKLPGKSLSAALANGEI
jgi:hypothetical protein